MGFIKRAWKGEEKLWKVFWLYNVLGGIALQLLTGVLAAIAAPLGMIGVAILIIYTIWVLVSLWKCAWNCGAKFWGYLVRILVVGAPIFFAILGLVLGGIMTGSDLVKKAECRAELKAKAVSMGVDPEKYVAEHKGECVVSENDADLLSSSPQTIPSREAPPSKAVTPTTSGMDAQTLNELKKMECTETLRQHAAKSGANVEEYVAKNQAWVEQCTKTMK